ncbi:hypothetical protein GCM10009621_11240 [Corynebacterium felinum]
MLAANGDVFKLGVGAHESELGDACVGDRDVHVGYFEGVEVGGEGESADIHFWAEPELRFDGVS